MMAIKFSRPWHYLTWKPPALCAEHEIALARKTRREGLLAMMRIFWGALSNEGRITWICVEIFIGHNWPIIVIGAGLALGLEDLWAPAAAWGATWLIGSIRHFGWLLWLLHRWPPLARG
jgi:hypothetical protein